MIQLTFHTSQKSQDTILLSSTQPFTEDYSTVNKPQYFRCITPLLVYNNNIQNLDNQQQVQGENYVQQHQIMEILKQEFIKKTLPHLEKPIRIYDGLGFTEQDIDKALFNYQEKKEHEAIKLFQKYENKLKKSQEKTDIWLENLKTINKGAYPYLKKLIDEKYSKNV